LEPTNGKQKDKDFADHLTACRQLISRIRSQYPNVSLYWKSPTAFHVHALQKECYANKNCIDRTRYMSNTLAKDLYVRQKQLMEELGVPFLDLFEATYISACWGMPGDGRHYRRWLNQFLNNYYYPGSKLP
jgi:hypothetical protein